MTWGDLLWYGFFIACLIVMVVWLIRGYLD